MNPIPQRMCMGLVLALMAASWTACSGKKSLKAGKGAADGSSSLAGPGAPGSRDAMEASIRGSAFAASKGLAPVYFDFDSAGLRNEIFNVLKENAAFLKARPGLQVLIAGHCDERGTLAYNLALGQSRARAVRDYYVQLGVPARSVATISYGEEEPVCRKAGERCWSLNRRAESRVRPGKISGLER